MLSKASRPSILFLFLLLLAMQLLASCAKEAEQVREGVDWLESFDEALRVAKKRNLPVMIDFYADWCRWCEKLDSETYVDDKVVSKARQFVSLKLDADVERAISSRYRVAGLPTILFIDPAGEEIHRVVGFRPPQSFVNEMNQALAAFRRRSGL